MAQDPPSTGIDDAGTFDEFRRRFMTWVGGGLSAAYLVLLVLWTALGATTQYLYILAAAVGCTLGAFGLARVRRGDASVMVFAYGLTVCIFAFLFLVDDSRFHRLAIETLMIVTVFSAALGSAGVNVGFALLGSATLLITGFHWAPTLSEPTQGYALAATDTVQFLLAWGAATLVSRHLRNNDLRLRGRAAELDRVVQRAERIALGDLSHVEDGGDGAALVMGEMADRLAGVVHEVQTSVDILGETSSEIASMVVEQERGAVHQASAVNETKETLESLAAASNTIRDEAGTVLANAEATLRTSERANERIAALSQHTRRIGELLELIKDVARKSEILALNAALEGSKAGEAGRGFSLVAGQMKQLAESTTSTIKSVKGLTSDITKATNAAVLAIEEATKLAASTTDTARSITFVTQQQTSSFTQVMEAIGDIASVTSEFAAGSRDTSAAAERLEALAIRLEGLAHHFVLEGG